MLGRGSVAVAVSALALAGAAASQGPPEAEPPIVSSTLLISGHGWGHGVGMSQWGAKGYADRGWTYDRILAHFYPGTRLGPAPPTRIRVLLAQGKKKLTLSSAAPWKLTDGAGTAHPLPAGPVTIDADLGVGGPDTQPVRLAGPLTFAPGTEPVALTRPYRGTIEVSVVAGKLQAIDVLALQNYLKGVVPAEMPFDWNGEALKAQAVAARSYALASRVPGRAWDLFSDVRSQAYLGLAVEKPSTSAAVDATKGEVLLYNGQVATTLFHSTSGGRTISSAEAFPGSKPVPYLVSVSDPYDTASPYHDWGPVLVDGVAAAKALKLPGQLVDLETAPGPSGRVAAATAHGTKGDAIVTGAAVRLALGLRSTWFAVDGLLSLSRPYGPVPYGSTVTISGTTRGVPDVVLEQRSGTVFWQPAPPVELGADGTFSFVVKPTATTEYRIVAGTARAFPLKVPVAPLVKLSQAPDGASLQGTTRPARSGAVVELQRQAGAAWATVMIAAVDSAGAFTVPAPLDPGWYRARFAPGGGLVAGTSPPLQIPS